MKSELASNELQRLSSLKTFPLCNKILCRWSQNTLFYSCSRRLRLGCMSIWTLLTFPLGTALRRWSRTPYRVNKVLFKKNGNNLNLLGQDSVSLQSTCQPIFNNLGSNHLNPRTVVGETVFVKVS